jgi:hypothetical protein
VSTFARLPADATCFATAIAIWRRRVSTTAESLMLLNAVSTPVQALGWTADYTSTTGPVAHIAREMPAAWGVTV